VRSAEQIGRTVDQWHDHQRAERERIRLELRGMQAQWERDRPDWYVWLMKRRDGEHDHGLWTADKKRAACPVRGCPVIEA
jgi:hypothetical protein